MKHLIDPHAVEKIRAAIASGKLKAGSWGDGTHTVCMMSAMVSGANSHNDCVTAGWPKWLVNLNVGLFDAKVGADDEDLARADFALSIAELAQTPRDYNRARDLFLIRRLDTGDHSALKSLRANPVDADWWRDCEAAIASVVSLLRRRLAGDDVANEMNEAASAADAAVDAVSVAFYAADAAFYAADAAFYAARAAAYAAARATRAASAAAYAADAALAANAAARAAAYAAARADLIQAISEA